MFSVFDELSGRGLLQKAGFGCEFMLSLTVFHWTQGFPSQLAFLQDVSTFWGSMGVSTWYKQLGEAVRR